MIEKLDKNRAKLTVNIGSGEERKRRSRIVEYTGKKDLERKYREFEEEVRTCRREDMSINALMNDYIRNREILGVRATTLHGYRNSKDRILVRFNKTLAHTITTYQINSFIADMSKQYSPKTIANTIFFLNACYEYAIRTERLDKNPCKNATLPKKNAKEIKTLSREDIQKLLMQLEKEPIDIRVGYKLALLCGLRRSEVLGLREADINLDFRCVTISKTRHLVEGEEYIQKTKTERSHRTLALPQTVCDDLAELIEEHHKKPYIKSDYIVQDGFGKPLNPSVFSDRLKLIEARADVEKVSLHGLRHTFATLLNAEGVDIAQISAELGHSNITTTLNTYTHVFGDVTSSSRGIADLIDKTLSADSATLSPLCENEKTANY